MRDFSPRNLEYMRASAEAWPDKEFVQQAAAQLLWHHQLALLDDLHTAETDVLCQALVWGERSDQPRAFDFAAVARGKQVQYGG